MNAISLPGLGFLCAVAFFAGYASAATEATLPADSLWRVVQICQQAQNLTNIPFPCLKVQPQTDSAPGFAIVPTPGAAAIMLVPTEKLSGIESPELLAVGAPNWWNYAWQARNFLIGRAQRPLSRNDIALAINSRGSRSQDQLHIHIGCIQPDVAEKLELFRWAITDTWFSFPLPLHSENWLAMRLVDEDLEFNPFMLLAKLNPAIRGSMADWGMTVVPSRFIDGTNGFLVLATKKNEALGRGGSGMTLVDPNCTQLE